MARPIPRVAPVTTAFFPMTGERTARSKPSTVVSPRARPRVAPQGGPYRTSRRQPVVVGRLAAAEHPERGEPHDAREAHEHRPHHDPVPQSVPAVMPCTVPVTNNGTLLRCTARHTLRGRRRMNQQVICTSASR